MRLQRGAEHLHCLDARSLAEFLAEIGLKADALRQIPSRGMISLVGADRFPPCALVLVPA
jgi:hypothetical protein